MPEPRFVAAPAPELTGYHPEAQVYTEMRPEQFLRNLGPTGRFMESDPHFINEDYGFYVGREHVEYLKGRMISGQEIDPLFIDYDPFQKKVVRHEGRHRALAASELGIDRVPVIVYFYDSKNYHDVKDEDGRVYDESHYISLEELGEGRINSALRNLGAERTYGIAPSHTAARRPTHRRDLSVHVGAYRRRA